MTAQKTANFFSQIFTGIPDLEKEEKTRIEDNCIKRAIRQLFVPDNKTKDELFDSNLQIAAGPHFQNNLLENNDVQIYLGGEKLTIGFPQSFEECNFDKLIMENIRKRNYKTPTHIQAAMVPLIRDTGYDIIGHSQTGTGKTAAFLLPIIDEIHKGHQNGTITFNSDSPYAIVLATTRELVMQLHEDALAFASGTDVSVSYAIGDLPTGYSIRELKKGCDILIATIGKLCDYLAYSVVTTYKMKYFVLDEADRFLSKLNALDDLRRLKEFGYLNQKHRTIMLSATFDAESLSEIKNEFMAEPHCWVRAGAVNQVMNTITQKILEVSHFQKRPTLLKLLLEKSTNLNGTFEEPLYKTEKTVVFIRGRRECDRLAIVLACEGFRVIPVNTHRTLRQRTEAVEKFKKCEYDILVSNDLLARGMNFPNVDHVINYDLPTPDNIIQYIHAVGRTGRAGNIGRATSFFDQYGPDVLLTNSLIQILEESMQEVPEFLRLISIQQQRIVEQNEFYQSEENILCNDNPTTSQVILPINDTW
ncbi:hypothetical protein Mgra_00000126 [Meloidogyne graminicola]|uniref:RNA helicase n=1 Tax=Meloidogyne graminicola TaxID=189291 RepID=A0A8T0A2I2_9BILA|nr:hypothetical protein Mgra_00000126 [Meloidogyne graminicola]